MHESDFICEINKEDNPSKGNQNCVPIVESGTNPKTTVMSDYGLSYAQVVEILADRQDEEIFDNSGVDHARAVMTNIFRTAKDYICIFAGNLLGPVSTGSYLEELRKFLEQPHTKLSVVLEDYKENSSSELRAVDIIREFQQKAPERVSLIVLEKDSPFRNLGAHFTISDDRMFRLETDIEKFTARCSFNNTHYTGVLKRLFNTIIS